MHQTCEHLNVTCPGYNVADLGVTIGYAKPSGTANGTIVFLSPEGGTAPSGPPPCPYSVCYSDAKYFDDYLASPNSFEVVQTAWDSAWEDTGSKNLQRNPRNVGYAAARAAALLSWIDVNLYGTLTKTTTAGMCSQGNSAGGGATAYILAWYGGYSYLDHAVFLSSPPLSDLEQGCLVSPQGQMFPVTVCPTGQLGCSATAPWTAWPQYTDALSGVRQWADDTTLGDAGVCRGTTTTPSQANTEWKAMSIVDGNVNVFSYPHLHDGMVMLKRL